jgi:hypothetical protein
LFDRFPYDYKAAEFKWDQNVNLTSLFIDSMAFIGLAYNRKSAPVSVVKARQERTGYSLPNPYWLWLNGLVGWVTSIAFTSFSVWSLVVLRMIYWRCLTLNPVLLDALM